MTAQSPLNSAKAEAFEEKFVETLNAGALCLMTSIGHRAGLFDLMADMKPGTAPDIAAAANLNERYVREWLGAMTVSGVVEHDPEALTFYLPPEHAAVLTRRAAPNNMAVFAQYMPLLGNVEDDILDCFKNGGGVPYSKFPRFHEVMAEDSGQSVVPALFDHILPLADGIQARLEDGIRVLDLGCGRARALIMMAEAYPNSTFYGYDLSQEALDFAKRDADQRGLKNIFFEVRDLTTFDQDAVAAQFDFITTFDSVHDQANPAAMLAGIRKSLKPTGVYLAQDIKGHSHVHGNIDHPIGPLLYTISCLHCMTVSLAQDGMGLGAMWGRELAEKMFGEAGFSRVQTLELDHDIQNNYYVCQA